MPFDTGRGARHLYWAQAAETPAGVVRPASDAQQQAGLHNYNFGSTTRVAFGRIVDGTAIAHCYKVLIEKGQPTMTAVMCGQTSYGAFGARQLNTLIPGTGVWLLIPQASYHAVIIGVEPPYMTTAQRSLVDWLSRCSRNRVDLCDKQPLLLKDNGGVTDWLAGRPFDSLLSGEAGWITETGLRITVDPFLVQLAVDESCGIFGFYHDQLLRVSGYNLQMLTAGFERDALADVAEYNDYEGYTPYPWEQLGLFTRGNPTQTKSPQQFQIDEPYYDALEPKADKQQPWHRLQHFRGYLGQGGRRSLVAPPASPPAQAEYEKETVYPGLFEDHLTLSGRAQQRSAKGFIFRKSMLIPGAQRLRRPEDPTGDTSENYKFAGIEGDGDEHKVQGDIGSADPTTSFLVSAAGIMDVSAYACNWEALHPFHYHEKDWNLPEESGLNYVPTIQPIDFVRLSEEQYLPPPEAVELKIDHRYDTVKYFPNEAFYTLTDDGCIIFGDGFGATIKMGHGNIELSCPGDIICRPGRNLTGWAGRDVNIRAKNSMDFSATEKDMRFKADGNMQFLAGNDADESSGSGGMLFESRAKSSVFDFENKVGEEVESAGIMFRAAHAPVIAWAKDVYLRTGGGEGSQKIDPGNIVLDANKGQSSVVTHASVEEHYTQTGIYQHFGKDGNIRKSNVFGESLTALGSGISADGNMLTTGGLQVKGNINIVDGHIASTQSQSFEGKVGELKGLPENITRSNISQAESLLQQSLPQQGKTTYKSSLDTPYYQQQKPGNDTVISQAVFSFRSQSQYKTTNWTLFEDRWQQLARLSNTEMPKWKERSVKAGSDVTYPYPGKEKFEEQSYKTLDLNGYDAATSRAKDRTADFYEDPQFAEPKEASLKDDYSVV